MSRTVTNSGKIQLIPRLDGENNISFAKRLFSICDYEFKQHVYDLYFEDLDDMEGQELFEEFIQEELPFNNILIIDGLAYKVLEKKNLDDEDIFEVKDLGNGEYSFLVQYYNGGCSFDEAIQYGFKKLKS